MDSMAAFAMGEANRGKSLMVFDWNKAAELIKKTDSCYASAGLRGDWDFTGGVIFEDGKIDTESYTYLSSTWATPEIILEGRTIECFIMQEDVPAEWGTEYASIKWPRSALEILGIEGESND